MRLYWRHLVAAGGIAAALAIAQESDRGRRSDDEGSRTKMLLPAAPPLPAGTNTVFGDAAWNAAMVQEYFKKYRNLDLAAGPDSWRDAQEKDLNPDFAVRLRTLMAVYAANGGQGLGIVPNNGALRDTDMQYALFKACRRLRHQPGGPLEPQYLYEDDPRPFLAGNKDTDWELVPVEDRVPERDGATDPVTKKPFVPGTVTYTWNAKTASWEPFVSPRRSQPPAPNCPVVTIVYPKSGPPFPQMGPATNAWRSWHNFGLAVDLTQRIAHDRSQPKQIKKVVLFDEPAWRSLTEAVSDLGMTWGGSFHGFPDLGHVEWHPRPALPRSSNDMEKGGYVAGRALSNDDIAAAYHWSIPARIFVWSRLSGKDGRAKRGGKETLAVYDLDQAGDCSRSSGPDASRDTCWIAVKQFRRIEYWDDNEWNGTWVTYETPVKLFPAYIPVVRLARGLRDYQGRNDTAKSSTDVTRVEYRVSRHGRQRVETTGHVTYVPGFTLHDWQMEANRRIGDTSYLTTVLMPELKTAYDRDLARYGKLAAEPAYELEAHLEVIEADEADFRRQGIDKDGYTTDKSGKEKSRIGTLGLALAWNRANGMIGSRIGPVSVSGDTEQLGIAMTAGRNTVSAKLPEGAHDYEKPPAEAASNPVPERPGKGRPGGFIPR